MGDGKLRAGAFSSGAIRGVLLRPRPTITNHFPLNHASLLAGRERG